MLRDFNTVIDPVVYCERGRTFKGQLSLSQMPRLQAFTVDKELQIDFDITFVKHARKRLEIEGTISGDLIIECQCCLKPMTLAIDQHFLLRIVFGLVEAEQLPEEIDPLLLDESEDVSITSIIEDELLLLVPMSPMHPEGCVQPDVIVDKSIPAFKEEKKVNPFAALAAMKDTD